MSSSQVTILQKSQDIIGFMLTINVRFLCYICCSAPEKLIHIIPRLKPPAVPLSKKKTTGGSVQN